MKESMSGQASFDQQWEWVIEFVDRRMKDAPIADALVNKQVSTAADEQQTTAVDPPGPPLSPLRRA